MDHIHYRLARGQTVTINNTAATSTTQFFEARIKLRVVTSVDAWIMLDIPANAAATVGGSSTFMAAGQAEYFYCRQGDVVSAIADQAGATGHLNVSELIR